MFVITDHDGAIVKDILSGQAEVYESSKDADRALVEVLEELPDARIIEVTLEKKR